MKTSMAWLLTLGLIGCTQAGDPSSSLGDNLGSAAKYNVTGVLLLLPAEPDSAAAAGEQMRLHSDAIGDSATIADDDGGGFSFSQVPNGDYRIEVLDDSATVIILTLPIFVRDRDLDVGALYSPDPDDSMCSDATDGCDGPVKRLGEQNGCACYACGYGTSTQHSICTEDTDARIQLDRLAAQSE